MVGSSRPKSFVRVAQELSNPLHAILLTAAMLREDVTDLQQGVELDVIRAPAARARETQGSDPPRDWSGYRSALALGIAGGGGRVLTMTRVQRGRLRLRTSPSPLRAS